MPELIYICCSLLDNKKKTTSFDLKKVLIKLSETALMCSIIFSLGITRVHFKEIQP